MQVRQKIAQKAYEKEKGVHVYEKQRKQRQAAEKKYDKNYKLLGGVGWRKAELS
jgi:hypothetical protein